MSTVQSVDDLTAYICQVDPKNRMTVSALAESIWAGFIAPRIRAVHDNAGKELPMEIKTFVKTQPIEAVQLDGSFKRASEIVEWIIDNGGNATTSERDNRYPGFEAVDEDVYWSVDIQTYEGVEAALPGSWIAKGQGEGEFWPIREDRFSDTYSERA